MEICALENISFVWISSWLGCHSLCTVSNNTVALTQCNYNALNPTFVTAIDKIGLLVEQLHSIVQYFDDLLLPDIKRVSKICTTSKKLGNLRHVLRGTSNFDVWYSRDLISQIS